MDTVAPLDVALVGCGAVAQLYYAPVLERLARSGQVRVVALVDPCQRNLDRMRQFFPEARDCDSIGGIGGSMPDLAIIASPPAYHAAQAIAFLEAGASVLCEKPLSRSAAEAEAMIAAAAASRRQLAVGHFRRFYPAIQQIDSMIATSLVGRPLSFRFHEGRRFSWPVQSDALFRRDTAGGGVLLDLGIHVIDLALKWFGEPSAVEYEDDAMGGLEANCRLSLEFAGGLAGEIRLSREYELDNRHFIQCELGWIAFSPLDAERIEVGFEGCRYVLSACLHESAGSAKSPATGRPAPGYELAFAGQVQDVVDALRHERPVSVPAESALAGLRLVERCYQSRRLLEMGWLSQDEREQAALLNAGTARC